MTESQTQKIIIDELLIHLGEWQVYRQDEKIDLTKQSLDLLLVLAKAWPNTVSQQQIMDEVWAGKVVGEQSVKQAVKRLRESLDDLGESYIKVVRGRGYRLECNKVEVIQQSPQLQRPAQQTLPQQVSKRQIPWLIGIAGCVLLVLFLVSNSPSSLHSESQSITHQTDSTSAQAYQYYISGLEYYKRYRTKDAKIAISQFNQAIELDANFVKAYAALSDAQAFIGDLDEAIVTAQHAISLDSNESAAYKALGHAYSIKGWFNKAIDTYQRALAIDPNNFAAITNAGFHLKELGQLDEALVWSFKALELEPNNAIVYMHIAETLSHLDMPDRALTWFEKVKRIRPDYHHLYYALTYYYLALGNQIAALNTLHQAQQILPDNGDITIAAGDVALVTGDHAKALKYFLRIVTSVQNEKLIHYATLRVGQIYWLQGEAQKANEFLNRALNQAQLMLSRGDEWPGNYVDIASIYAIKQSHKEALAWLNRAYDVGWVNYKRLSYDPAFKDMQNLAQLSELTTKVKNKVMRMKNNAQQLAL